MSASLERTSLDDERLAGYRLVADPQALADRKLFVAEGRLVVRRLVPLSDTPGHRFEGVVESVLVTPAAAAQLSDLVAGHPGVRFFVVPQAEMNDLVGFNIHRGCLALARRPATPPLTPAALSGARSVVVLEGVNNPDNVGGIFRSAAAFGVDLIVLGPRSADPLYRKSIRTSMGAALVVPYVEVAEWPDAIEVVRKAGLRTIALTPEAGAIPLDAVPADGRPFALLAGAEGAGLSPEAEATADARARIPMTGLVDSLNVTTAVSIALYHLRRGSLQ